MQGDRDTDDARRRTGTDARYSRLPMKTWRCFACGFCFATSLAACGSSKSTVSPSVPGSASVTGTVADRAFSAQDAAGLVGTTMVGNSNLPAVQVYITSYSGICTWLKEPTGIGYANATGLILAVVAPSAGSAVTAGTYSGRRVASGKQATARSCGSRAGPIRALQPSNDTPVQASLFFQSCSASRGSIAQGRTPWVPAKSAFTGSAMSTSSQ
jgi:hypothetical protein